MLRTPRPQRRRQDDHDQHADGPYGTDGGYEEEEAFLNCIHLSKRPNLTPLHSLLSPRYYLSKQPILNRLLNNLI